jgi:hypothetical protein
MVEPRDRKARKELWWGERMPMRTKNLASEEKSPGYATPKSRLVPEKHLSK